MDPINGEGNKDTFAKALLQHISAGPNKSTFRTPFSSSSPSLLETTSRSLTVSDASNHTYSKQQANRTKNLELYPILLLFILVSQSDRLSKTGKGILVSIQRRKEKKLHLKLNRLSRKGLML